MSRVLGVEPLARSTRRTDVPVSPRTHERGSRLQRQKLLARLRRHIRCALELTQWLRFDAIRNRERSVGRTELALGFSSRCHQNLVARISPAGDESAREPLLDPKTRPPAPPQLAAEFKAPASATSRKRLAIAPISSGVGRRARRRNTVAPPSISYPLIPSASTTTIVALSVRGPRLDIPSAEHRTTMHRDSVAGTQIFTVVKRVVPRALRLVAWAQQSMTGQEKHHEYRTGEPAGEGQAVYRVT